MDKALQTTINEWFQNREVVDDDYFELYFRRILNRDYGRYTQILRLEPEISEYDWLVEEYLERKSEHSGSNKQSGTTGNTLTHGLKVTSTDTTAHTGTVSRVHTQLEAENYDNTSESESGENSNTNTKTQGADDNYDTKESTVKNIGNNSSTRTDNLTETNSASSTRTDNLTETTSTTQDTTSSSTQKDDGTVSHLKKQGYKDNEISYSKVNPASISYTDDQINDALTGGNHGAPTPDWHYPSTQGQRLSEHEITGTDPDTDTTDNLTTNNGTEGIKGSGTRTNTGTVENADKSTKSNTGTVENADKKDETQTVSETNKISRNEQEIGSGSDSRTRTNKVGFNRNETNTDTYDEQNNVSRETLNSGQDVNSGTTNSTGSDESADYEIHSGRHGEISQMLDRAVAFISKTSAWEWLEPRLEVCFMGVYDV